MAFVTPEELNTVLYNYQLNEIVEQDSDIVLQNIAAAEQETKSYLNIYDVDTIFSKTGTERDPLLMEIVKNIALWYIIRLSNVDILDTKAKDRYDRAVNWLKGVADGVISPTLPLITGEDGQALLKFKLGSNQKFNHQY